MTARRLWFPLAVVAVVAAGCSGPAPSASPASEPAAPAPEAEPAAEAASGSPSLAELEALYRARRDSTQSVFSEADALFMTGMIGHHAQALVMAGMAERNGASPQVQTLAARIANAQHDEIATMQRWLRDRGQPAPEVRVDGARLWIRGGLEMDHGAHGAPEADGAHAMHGGEHDGHDMGAMDPDAERDGTALHAGMAGMLTQAQLDELDAARGADFDRLFLTYMIQHHSGAVTMVDTLFATDGAAMGEPTFKLASDIQVDQRTEIARMQRMLDALGD